MERSATNSWGALLGVAERRSFFVDFLSKKVCEFSKRGERPRERSERVGVSGVNLRTSSVYEFGRMDLREVGFPNGALKPTCKAAFEGHRNKTKLHKEGWPNGARA